MLLVQFGESFRNAVSLFFIRDIVGVPTIGAAYFFYFIAGLGAIPFWLWLGRTIGKHRAFMCTLITVACVSGANLLLDYGDYLDVSKSVDAAIQAVSLMVISTVIINSSWLIISMVLLRLAPVCMGLVL